MRASFIGYSHDDRPMFWVTHDDALCVVYGEPVTESIGLWPGDETEIEVPDNPA